MESDEGAQPVVRCRIRGQVFTPPMGLRGVEFMELSAAEADRRYRQAILLGHCPTLLGGDSNRNAASVRVWAPDTRGTALCLFLLLVVLSYLAIFEGLRWVHGRSPSLDECWPFGLLLTFAPLFRQYRNPHCIVTDEVGIAIAGRRGVRSLRWGDVTAAHHLNATLSINDGEPEPIVVDLDGLTNREAKVLMGIIIEKAELKWQPRSDPYTSFRGDGDWVRTTNRGLADFTDQNDLIVSSTRDELG